MRRFCPLVFVALVLLCAGIASPEAFKTEVKSVAVFKDNYGFFLREGQARLEKSWCMTDYIPPAIRGSFYIFGKDPQTAIDTVITTQHNRLEFNDTAELKSILETKVGLTLRITTAQKTVVGKLVHVLEDMILLSGDAETLAVRYDEMKTVEYVGYPMKIMVVGTDPNATVSLGIGYLRAGIQWFPTYLLDLLDESHAFLTLRGTVVNGAEALKDCNVYLVVGVPNFLEKGNLDELTLNRLAEAEGYAAERDRNAMRAAQVMAPNAPAAPGVAGGAYGGYLGATPVVGAMVGLAGQEMAELFFYQKQKLSLEPGEVAMVTVFTGTVEYESLFDWDADAEDVVWRILQIKNSLQTPLTTGPAMAMRNGQPVGQDQITYTAPGATSDFLLTVAGGFTTFDTERELERGEPQNLQGILVTKVKTAGELEVTNYTDKDAKVRITKRVFGRVTEQSDGGEILGTTVGQQRFNPLSTMRWVLTIPAGQSKKVTYTYESLLGREEGAPAKAQVAPRRAIGGVPAGY